MTNPFGSLEGYAVPQPGVGGYTPATLGDSFGELLGALMSQQQYGRERVEEGRGELQKQAAAIPRQARAGVKPQQQQVGVQMAQRAGNPGPIFTDPMVEMIAAQKLQMALQNQYAQQLRQIMAMQQPGFMEKYGGLMGTLGGAAIGGYGLIGPGGVGAATLGGTLGGGIGGLTRA